MDVFLREICCSAPKRWDEVSCCNGQRPVLRHAQVKAQSIWSLPLLWTWLDSRGAIAGWKGLPLAGHLGLRAGEGLPSLCFLRSGAAPSLGAWMVPAPGTPLGGERPRRQGGEGDGMDVDAGAVAPADVPMASAAAPSPGQRLFCPVAGCPCADAARARGWTSAGTLRLHVDAHLAGSLAGRVPSDWLQTRNLQRCLVCGLSVATRFGIHPTCRPTARATAGAGVAQPRADGSPDGPLPSLTEIQCSNAPTLRHVPAGARHAWAQALTRACAAVADYNDERAWVHLLMLPQAVLCSPPRGGGKHHRAAAAFTLERLQRWQDGERASLWASRPQPPRSSARKLTDEQRQTFAINLAREGFDKKACTALLSQGLCHNSPATVAALQALHPTAAAPTVPPLDDLPVAPLLDLENVTQAIRSLPADTAPGPTGLRVQHLRDALHNGGGAGLLDQLTTVVNLLAQGRACAAVAPLLAGAGLVALSKPGGGVRPIAVGEVLRRITAKCLMHEVRAEARNYLWPAQAGVAVKGGAEAAVHTLRAWVGRHAGSHDSVVVKIDFQNAFNTIDRDAVLREAREQFPALARWVTWCYQNPSNLQFGDAILQSSCGVQQGDPLGPLLFSAGVQPLAAGLQRGAVDFSVFYLDDGVLAGSLAAVSDALVKLQQAAAALGLTVNLSKSEAIAVGMTSTTDMAAKLPPALVRSADGNSRILTDFEFLGAAIGRPAHLQAHAAARVEGARKLLEAVGALPDPQVALRLLRASAGYARLVHTMRCCPPAGHAAALQAFDALVQDSFSSLSGLHLEPEQWQQATRGFAQAGLGLRSTQAHAPAAYLASVGSCSQQCQELDAGYWVDHSGDVAAALSDLNARLSPACHLTAAGALALSQFKVNSATASMQPDGNPTWTQLRKSRKQLFFQKLVLAHSWPAFLLAGPRWSQLCSLQSCGCAFVCLNPVLTPGAPSAMQFWTHMATMLGCAWQGVREPFGTMRYVTWFTRGLSEAVSARNEKKRVCCYLTDQMMWAVPAVGLPMSSSQLSWVVPPQSISPLRLPSGWMSWARGAGLRLPRSTLSTKSGTWTLQRLALPNMWSFFHWLQRLLVLGRLKPPRLLTISAAQLVPPMEAHCFRRLVCWFALGGPERPCADGLSWRPRSSGCCLSPSGNYLWEPVWSAGEGMIGPPCFCSYFILFSFFAASLAWARRASYSPYSCFQPALSLPLVVLFCCWGGPTHGWPLYVTAPLDDRLDDLVFCLLSSQLLHCSFLVAKPYRELQPDVLVHLVHLPVSFDFKRDFARAVRIGLLSHCKDTVCIFWTVSQDVLLQCSYINMCHLPFLHSIWFWSSCQLRLHDHTKQYRSRKSETALGADHKP